MSYRVVETERALSDLDGIISYIARTLCNKKAAADLLDSVDGVIKRLCDFPFAYPACVNERFQRYRKAVFASGYLLIYRVDEAASTVYIERYVSDLEDYFAELI